MKTVIVTGGAQGIVARDCSVPALVITSYSIHYTKLYDGGLLGIMALSQMDSIYTRPMPPQRICRDTYNYYDENGRFMYSRYVDRPCGN